MAKVKGQSQAGSVDSPDKATAPIINFNAANDWIRANWPRHWELALYAGLIAVAGIMRLWALGSRAYNHDESLHAQFSWQLYDGQGYTHDPVYHGPFQYHFNALIFKIADFLGDAPLLSNFVDWGVNDFTGRLLPAIFGTALVALPFFLRGHIGRLGAFLAAIMLAFSPVLLFFSRFARNDIYIGFWTLAIVVCIWRYLDERKTLYLYVIAGLLALSFATKEVTFITAALFILYLDLLFAWEIVTMWQRRGDRAANNPGPDAAVKGVVGDVPKTRRRKQTTRPPQASGGPDFVQIAAGYFLAALFGWLIVITWPFTGRWRRRLGLEEMPAVGDLLLVMGTLAAPQFAAMVQAVPFVGNSGYYLDPGTDETSLMMVSVLLLIIATSYVGLLWRPRTWAICAGIYYLIYILLYTTFFSNLGRFWEGEGGLWSGIWGSPDYWLEQQGVVRGDQPIYYYLMILPMYEFLAVAFAIAGVVYYLIRRRLFTLFLVFWTIGALAAFAYAGERMPWLTVHMSVPIIILAATLLNDVFQHVRVKWPLQWPQAGTLIVTGAGIGALAMLVLWAGFFSFPSVAFALLLGVAALAVVFVAWRWHGLLPAGQTVAALGGAALLVLTVRAAGLAAYDEGDYPNEMLSYADMSPDIPYVRDELVKRAELTGLGYDYPIVIDSELAWPFVWYLRDYTRVSWADTAIQPPVYAGSIIVLSNPNQSFVDPYLDDYEPPVSIRHLWWFGDGPQDYDHVSFGDFFSMVFDGGTWDTWRDYFLYRDTPWGAPPDDAYVYFPKSLENAGAVEIETPPPIPAVNLEKTTTIGVPGSEPGQFALPTGLEVDAAGNLYVADSNNNRIQKFGPNGNLLATVTGGNTGELSFDEPWGLAVDAEGNLYVADTWNHRIQKFNSNLDFIASWASGFVPEGEQQPAPDELYGPRDIAVDADGNLLLTDTGNKRIVKFSPDGEALGSYGEGGTAPGQFSEPVGIAVAANGEIYVADTWNLRVQRFDGDFNFLDAYTVRGWGSTEVTAKPYLALLPDGSFVLTNPANARIELYDKQGEPLRSWELPTQAGAAKARPIGIAVGSGFVYVADGVGNTVYRLDLNELLTAPATVPETAP